MRVGERHERHRGSPLSPVQQLVQLSQIRRISKRRAARASGGEENEAEREAEHHGEGPAPTASTTPLRFARQQQHLDVRRLTLIGRHQPRAREVAASALDTCRLLCTRRQLWLSSAGAYS